MQGAIRRSTELAFARYGLTTAASRVTTGNHRLYERLESSAARFFGSESSLVLSSGYLANVAVGEGLRGLFHEAFVDDRCHGSLPAALRGGECRVTTFEHRSCADLRRKRGRVGRGKRVVIVTDGVFAADGAIAPLREYRQAMSPGDLLWVDDAHAAGVIGKGGRGSIEYAEIPREDVIQTITFSKAFGAYGGAVLCDRALRGRLLENSAAVIGNTPLPLPLAGACLKSLTLMTPARVAALQRNIQVFWTEYSSTQPPWPTPIVRCVPSNPAGLKNELRRNGIFPSHIQYPGGPPEGYFRFALSSRHTASQIRLLAQVLRRAENRVEGE
jgi:8-amino-7-oxononanoate synthase